MLTIKYTSFFREISPSRRVLFRSRFLATKVHKERKRKNGENRTRRAFCVLCVLLRRLLGSRTWKDRAVHRIATRRIPESVLTAS
jgi:hypothetical protein